LPEAAAIPIERVRPAARRVAPPLAVLAALLLLSGSVIMYAGRHLTFFYDEWDLILGRRGGGLGTYLDPLKGHLALFQIVVYKLLFAIVGLRHYAPYLAVTVALHLLCGVLLYMLARRRLGPWLGLAPTALLLFMGSAYQDLLWPFQIGWFASVAGGLGVLIGLERQDRRGDLVAAVLLAWSLTGSGVGVAFLVAGAVALLGQRGPWRRAWVIAVPGALFALWYLGWGTSQHFTSDAVLRSPQYVADAAAGAMAGIAGLTAQWGPPLAIGAFAAILVAVKRRGGEPAAVLLAAAAGVITFWLLDAVARADFSEPTASRYLYIGAVFILVIACEAWARVVVRRGWAVLGLALLAGAIVGNLDALRGAERTYRPLDASVRASLAAVELSAPVVKPAFKPDGANAPQVTAGPYLAAVHDLGSPALTLSELERSPENTRAHSDQVLEQAERIAVVPATGPASGGSRPHIVSVTGGRLTAVGLCDRVVPTASEGVLDVAVPPGGQLLVHVGAGNPVAITLRRVAASFGAPIGFVAGGKSATIGFPTDRAPQLAWHAYVFAARAQAAEVCGR
jgi:hypothetical protein